MNLIAVDPGASGGIALLINGQVSAHKMPETPTDVFALIHRAGENPGPVKAYVEEVGGFTGEGQPGSAMFSFGRGFGQIEGILIALRIPFELVKPQRWQKALALGTSGRIKGEYKGLSPEAAKEEKKRISTLNAGIKRDWKNKLKAMAQRLYPQLKVTLANCDALLLLEYGQRNTFTTDRLQPQPVAIAEPMAPLPQESLL